MSIFNTILHKLFPADRPVVASAVPPVTSTASAVPDIAVPGSTQPITTSATMATAALQVPHPDTAVDVDRVLSDMAASKSEALDWRTSIVDLLKVLDLNSDLDSRMDLAKEMSYDGDMNDSEAMNVWLHREVMHKLAINGGRVQSANQDA